MIKPSKDGNDLTATIGGVEQTLDISDVKVGTVLNFDVIGVKFTYSSDTAAGDVIEDNITTAGTDIKFQIGANQDTVLDISIGNIQAEELGKGNGGDATKAIADFDVRAGGEGFDTNIQIVDEAIKQVSAQRSQLGAWQNRLEHTINNLDTSSENLQAAESRIRDVYMAAEMMEMTKNNILQQASQAMLAQANQAPQSVLQLLG